MRNIILKMFNIEFSPEDYNNKAKKYNKAANAFPATMIVVFTDTTDDAAVFE